MQRHLYARWGTTPQRTYLSKNPTFTLRSPVGSQDVAQRPFITCNISCTFEKYSLTLFFASKFNCRDPAIMYWYRTGLRSIRREFPDSLVVVLVRDPCAAIPSMVSYISGCKPVGLQTVAPATIKNHMRIIFRKRCARKFDKSCKIFFFSEGEGVMEFNCRRCDNFWPYRLARHRGAEGEVPPQPRASGRARLLHETASHSNNSILQ